MTLFHIHHLYSISLSKLFSIRFEDRAKVLSKSDMIAGGLPATMES